MFQKKGVGTRRYFSRLRRSWRLRRQISLDYITTAPPPNLTRLLHNTASYEGYIFPIVGHLYKCQHQIKQKQKQKQNNSYRKAPFTNKTHRIWTFCAWVFFSTFWCIRNRCLVRSIRKALLCPVGESGKSSDQTPAGPTAENVFVLT